MAIPVPGKLFSNAKKQLLAELANPVVFDRSKKGGVDVAVADLCSLLNRCPCYVTTSSCSGRIAIGSENPGYLKQGTEWLFVSHEVVDFARDVAPALARLPQHPNVLFKFEPFVLHTSCASLEAAKALLQVALQCGFKNSGIMLGKKTMVAVRSTLKLEVPLCHNGHVLVGDTYVQALVDIVNSKMAENFSRISRFQSAVAEAFAALLVATEPPDDAPSAGGPAPSAPAHSAGIACALCPALIFPSRNQLFKHIAALHPKMEKSAPIMAAAVNLANQ